ncbi:MAG: ATP-binding protein [Candidatus Omnitrophica bacterium]|nr:ATP-binding protein [Candidatus Omnitrophota bacterium]
MIERTLYALAFSSQWGRQMRFIIGPRQSGKTTLAKAKLTAEHASNLYYLWDLRTVRNRYKENELFFTQDSPPTQKKQWVCFDEIHKIPKWKNTLKAIFDASSEHYQFVVTGSSKMDIFRKAGDALSGRYFTFHLFPLSFAELVNPNAVIPYGSLSAAEFVQTKLSRTKAAPSDLSDLLEFGGFPEPFVKQSKTFLAKWSRDYTDTVIKEDIGALTRIIDREHLYDLYNLLPEMTGSPISESSLAAHLSLSPPTIKQYLKRLEDFYLAFKVHPYFQNIKRALVKAPKCYLYDWTKSRDEAKRFENFVAVELMTQLSLWSEASADSFRLFYIRTKQKEETDFLIVKNQKPWLLMEAKLADSPPAGHHHKIQAMLGALPFVQICRQEGVAKMTAKSSYSISASRFLA